MFDDGDLFEMANSLARLVGAPVTIEDRDTIVIAYSGGDQDVDEARIGTILGRQVPVRFREAIAEAGVFDLLDRSDEVIVVDLPELKMVPRAVVAVRDSGRLVGSIWAAVGGEPDESQRTVLQAAAPIIAGHLRRERERADAVRRERGDVVARLLTGGESAEEVAAERLMVGPWVVVAMRGDADEVPHEIWGALSLHLSAVAPAAVCAPLGNTVYGVLAVDSATRIMTDFMERFRHRSRVAVGVGSPALRAAALGESQAVADQVADTLLRHDRFGAVQTLAQAYVEVLVDRLEPFVAAHPEANPLSRLEAYDAAQQAGLVDAVRAFLEEGDIGRAAGVLHVHPNTARNRLRRARESCGVDVVGDPDTRLALMIGLRIARPRSS